MSTLDPIRPVSDAAVNAVADKVGNLVGTCWDYSVGLVVNIICLSRKAEEVSRKMESLQDRSEDLQYEAEDEARKSQRKVLKQLSGWRSRVSSLATDASNFQKSFEDQSFCITRFRLGFDAMQLLRQMRRLTEEGKAFSPSAQLSRPRGPDPVEQVPSKTCSSTLVGGRDALQRVESYIMDDGVGIIGIYGMGGVGKTSLLNIINNEFLLGEACRDKFEVAIWVTVSRDVQISTIQKSIADRLRLPSDTRKDELFGQLSKKRFVLLLDDVWEKLDLTEIGIPLPRNSKNRSKILFTTRTEQVCGEMDFDQKVNINLLDDKSSWDLFRSKFGRDAAVLDVDPHIRQLAKEVVGRCGGLPIALITVGMAMSNAKTAYDWKDAIRKLDQCASQLSPGMEEVLKSLKFSFEKLKNEALRNCLLYCALFPEDYKIPKVEIIDYWICEGFLDLEDFDEYDIEDTRCRGNALISELQNACLLEEVSDDFVTLHDTIRDMTLWIAGHDFVVLAGSNSNATQVPKLSIWEMARRISLIRNEKIEELPSSSSSSSPCRNLSFPNLTTLLLQSSLLAKNVPEGFFTFTSMPTLRVLDLARTGLSEFPIEITSLTCLQYLSLSENEFTSLPVELGNLTNLRQLILRNTLHLTSISREAISHLSRLQVLDMEWSDYEFGDDDTRPLEMGLSDLANLSRLVEFHLPKYKYWSWRSFGVFEASPVLRRSIRSLGIRASCDASGDCVSADTISERVGRLSGLRRLELQGESYDPVMGELQLYPVSRLQNLVFLRIEYFRVAKISINISSCHGSEPLFPRLRELRIKSCDGWSEMTWLGRLPCLEELYIGHCKWLREVLMQQRDGGDHDHLMITPFPKLTSMNLQNLPSLMSISMRPLPFPSLKIFVVRGCPRLKRLPFGPHSAKNLTHIFGQEAWWDGLEWDNDADQQSFSSKFKAVASFMPPTL